MKKFKLGWVTDPHIDHCSKDSKSTLFNEIKAARLDGLMVTGDITTSSKTSEHLYELADLMNPKQLFFVLGNHDFWGSNMVKVRNAAQSVAIAEGHVNYLPSCDPIELSTNTCITGVDGWYDAAVGNLYKLIMNEWRYMSDFAGLQGDPRLVAAKSKEIASIEADLAKILLKKGAEGYHNVIFATHIPPWPESAWYMHHQSEDGYVPWFSSITIGKAIEEVALEFPSTNFHVFCGHTHGSGEYWPSKNIRCRTGKPGVGDYGNPKLVEVLYV